jgi:putative lipoprotein
MSRRIGLIHLPAMALLGAVLMAPALADEAALTGSIVYRERMLLPEGAQARVTLEDVSRADAPATVIAETSIPAAASPIPFTLAYPAYDLSAGHSYALRASISLGGELLFTTTDAVAFDPSRLDGYELLVRRTAGTDQPALALKGTWLAEDIAGGGVIDNLQTTLEIAEDGTVNGMGGCNRYRGSAEIEGEAIKFSRMVATLMACSEAVSGQERKFFDALAKATNFRIDTPTRKLFLLDANGNELVRLAAN